MLYKYWSNSQLITGSVLVLTNLKFLSLLSLVLFMELDFQNCNSASYPKPFHINTIISLILASHLCSHLTSGLLPSGVPSQILYKFYIFLKCALSAAHLILLYLTLISSFLCLSTFSWVFTFFGVQIFSWPRIAVGTATRSRDQIPVWETFSTPVQTTQSPV